MVKSHFQWARVPREEGLSTVTLNISFSNTNYSIICSYNIDALREDYVWSVKIWASDKRNNSFYGYFNTNIYYIAIGY